MRSSFRPAAFVALVWLLVASVALGAEPSSGAVDWELVPYFQNRTGSRLSRHFPIDGMRIVQSNSMSFPATLTPEVERPATYMAAVCTLYAGRYKDALRRFEALSKTYPLLRHYHSFFRKAHRKLGNFEGAIQAFTSVPLRMRMESALSEMQSQPPSLRRTVAKPSLFSSAIRPRTNHQRTCSLRLYGGLFRETGGRRLESWSRNSRFAGREVLPRADA